MAVIINEFEVVTEPPPPQTDVGTRPGNAPRAPQPPPLTPDVVHGIWRRALDRWSRCYAG
jgi:hypothetical protein